MGFGAPPSPPQPTVSKVVTCKMKTADMRECGKRLLPTSSSLHVAPSPSAHCQIGLRRASSFARRIARVTSVHVAAGRLFADAFGDRGQLTPIACSFSHPGPWTACRSTCAVRRLLPEFQSGAFGAPGWPRVSAHGRRARAPCAYA